MKSFVRLAVALLLFLHLPWALAGATEQTVLRVGTDGFYPPYVSRGPEGLVGLDVDLTEALAERIDRKVQWVERPFEDLMDALLSGEIDVIAASISVTDERARRVAFTEAYEISRSTFVLRAGETLDLPEELRMRRVAVLAGTVQEDFLRTVGDVEVLPYQSVDSCFLALVAGEVDATLVERPVAVRFASKGPFAGKIALPLDWEIPGASKALAVGLDDGPLLVALNEALAELKAEGFLTALRDKWMDF